MKWTMIVTRVEYMRKSLQNIFEERKRKIKYSRPRRGWENNIKIDLKEIGYETVNCISMEEDGFL
jgi:hypothetical protein